MAVKNEGLLDLEGYLEERGRHLVTYTEGATMYHIPYYSFVRLAKEVEFMFYIRLQRFQQGRREIDMEQNGDFKYFTGQETMQFAFIPVPMAQLSDPRYENLSSDAKLLYALLLNRMNLSRKNGWFDEEKRVFIYYF